MLIDDLKSRFPNLSSALIDLYFVEVEKIYPQYYGGAYGVTSKDDEIILNLLAHLISITEMQTVPVYEDEKDFFTQTMYGQTFLHLIKPHFGIIFT